MTTKKKKTLKSLRQGRPPTVRRSQSISRKATRTVINTHHLLERKKSQAISKGDQAAEAAVNTEIAALGGLERYQQASLQGQREDRGGDSSRVLLEWLRSILPYSAFSGTRPFRMLEVGALSTTNECSRSGLFEMERIDLNSQSEGILQQDFMRRPLPKEDRERFDIISLSLVLNFVPNARDRGDMLLRTLDFLRNPSTDDLPEQLLDFFPSLFMVLPAPCITNSRYMNEARITSIMEALGYAQKRNKTTQKLVYYLWTRKLHAPARSHRFKKTEVRAGHSRNNFSIVIDDSSG